ncbi:hypothetical protein [Chitinolyticbacter meiyuanensis]|uniref:hypothetical protein n=1 Tax=Chitinolyticbacter meiyuanensis TaxID=682798 RepID=UPI0011E5D86C|nr:hypothetical protein [Chitinolyticbacter meiyuanensis]
MAERDDLEQQAFQHAQHGIKADCDHDWPRSVEHWHAAAMIADAGLRNEPFHHWVMAGYAQALCQMGEWQHAIGRALPAHAWHLEQQQPLTALTLARAHLELEGMEAALPYLRDAYRLGGEDILSRHWFAANQLVRIRQVLAL